MKTNETAQASETSRLSSLKINDSSKWFISLVYGKWTFLIPHKFSAQNGAIPDIFIDFDKIALEMFSAQVKAEHPVAITIKCTKTAMLTTSAIPAIFRADLKDFFIPEGLLEEPAKRAGIIAISFKNDAIAVIINPELLYNKWSAGQ